MKISISFLISSFILFIGCKNDVNDINQNSILSESKNITSSFDYYRNFTGSTDSVFFALESSKSDITLFINFYISERNIKSYNYTILKFDTSTISNVNFFVRPDYTEILWTSFFEENNMGWEIERKDSNQSYIKIGFITGNGTSNEIHQYSFKDNEDFSKTFYYRVKQIDFDGTYTYPMEAKIEVDAIDSIKANFSITSDSGVIKYNGEIAPDSGYKYNLLFDKGDIIYFKNSLSHYGKFRLDNFNFPIEPSLNLNESHLNINYELGYEIFIQTSGERTFY